MYSSLGDQNLRLVTEPHSFRLKFWVDDKMVGGGRIILLGPQVPSNTAAQLCNFRCVPANISTVVL